MGGGEGGVLAVPARAPRGVSRGVVEPFRDAWVPGGYRERGRVDAAVRDQVRQRAVLHQPGGHLEDLLDAFGFKAAAAAVPAAPKRERCAQTVERTLYMLRAPLGASLSLSAVELSQPRSFSHARAQRTMLY